MSNFLTEFPPIKLLFSVVEKIGNIFISKPQQQQQTEQQKSMNMTMNIMMYGMPIMMVVFIIQSPV